MIELDVQLTRDREVVVVHDWTLGRCSNGRGRVASRTLAELRRLDVGSWFDPAFAGERMPTLAEVLDACGLPVNVELKARPRDGLEARALAVVRAASAENRVVFSSFQGESLVRLRRQSDDVAIAVLWPRRRLTAALRLAAGVRATALHIRKDAASPAEVAVALAAGLEVRAWTVNDPAEFVPLGAMGVRGVFTDFPERFLQLPAG